MRLAISIGFLMLMTQFIRAQYDHTTPLLDGNVLFTIENAGFPVEGTIGELRGQLEWDTRKPEKSIINITANPATIKTGIGLRDKHLKRSDYFDVESYPEIHMNLRSLKQKSPKIFMGDFDLTMKGITREVTIPLNFSEDNSQKLSAEFEINRLDFDLGEKSLILSDKVNIYVTLDL
ncbi:YceI family protein [Zeaxanthinibacter enoshimensis]|uniref:Polyisoprenoid-binding protein YceI n=1 Tax=Zeaxanthinibacter enoshimensis TaxID=392009 RepID=A0A4R6TKV0_9FLAO|nr:YceI family protein [Zeaxanthinibacter enoshimensis]TDQ31102.1 polyisoprenoid-binding protein YceI [Zeaxanthinibacter enoshimensis]